MVRGRGAVVGVVLLACGVAFAQTTPEVEAQAHFDRGVSLGDQDMWPEAIREFEAARDLMPLPAVLFNLAEAYRRTGRLRDALAAYRLFLERASPTSQYRPAASEQERLLGQRIPVLRLEVTPPGARVLVDEVEITSRELPLDPGPHAITVRAEGYEPFARTMTLAAGRNVELAVQLARLSSEVVRTVVVPAPPVALPPVPQDRNYRDAFQMGGFVRIIGDDGRLGSGLGLRIGMRLSRNFELLASISRDTSNGVTYTTGGFGAFYVAPTSSLIGVYMGGQVGVLVPQCSQGCTYANSPKAAETDLSVLLTVGARLTLFRWMSVFLEGSGGVARVTDPVALLYLMPGVQFALEM